MAHINTIIPDTLELLQFAYRSNRSTDEGISIALHTALHTALSHLCKRNTHVRMLFIDYSLAFKTKVPSKLIAKDPAIEHLSLQLDPGLPNRPPQAVRVGNITSATQTLNTGAPQGGVLSPLMYSLFTHDCVAAHNSNTIIMFLVTQRW